MAGKRGKARRGEVREGSDGTRRTRETATHQLLVRDADLDGLTGRAVLEIPVLDERHVLRAHGATRALVVRVRRPPQRDGIGRAVRLDVVVGEERLARLGQLKVVVLAVRVAAKDLDLVRDELVLGRDAARRDRVDHRVKVEGGEVRVLGADVEVVRLVVGRDVDAARARVVQVRERDLVLGADLLPDDDLVDVVELVPVVVKVVGVAEQGLEARATGDGHVERLGREERLGLEQVEVVGVVEVAQEGAAKAVQVGHLRQVEVPQLVARPVDVRRVEQRLRVVEPLGDWRVLVLVELELDRLERLCVEHVVSVVERRLLVVERREAHALEVATVALLAPHGEPHGGPLGVVHGRDHLGHLVDERDGAGDVVDDGDLAHLLPRHRHVLEELEHGVRDVLRRRERRRQYHTRRHRLTTSGQAVPADSP